MTPSSTPATILFYSHTGSVSGAEVVLLSILEGLDRTRYRPLLISPEGDLARSAAGLQVDHLPLPVIEARFTKNPAHLLRYAAGAAAVVQQLRSLLRQQRPALVHANSIRAGIVASAAARGLRLPVVWHLHDILPASVVGKALRKLAGLQRQTALLAVSRATARGFTHLGGIEVIRKPVEVVYNSVDTARFRPDAAERIAIRRDLHLADSDIAIGVIAQITPRKRQVELVRAFAAASSSMPEAKLIFIGAALFNQQNQEYADLLRATVAELGLSERVLLAGKRSDVPAVLNALDIVAQNSDREPLGMTLLEGMASEKPVVTTSVDGTPEVVDDGIDGFLTPVDAPDILMERLRQLSHNPLLRDSFGGAGRRKAESRFSQEEQMRRMHAFYDRLLASPGQKA